MADDIFMQATRCRLRFPSPIGYLRTEDLWSIALTSEASTNGASVEGVGAALLARQQQRQDQSVLRSSSSRSEDQVELDLQVAIIRKVAEIREDEAEAKTLAASKASERRRLERLLAQKEEQELTAEQIQARLDSL